MGRIATVVFAASRRSLSWLFRRRASISRRHIGSAETLLRKLNDGTLETVFGQDSLVMTPAQAAAFATRSFTWRCVSCGKVHAFDMPVRVGAASPCSCLQIEFETDTRRRPSRYGSLRGLPEASGPPRTSG
jgi:hypothetical protein